MSLLSRDLLFLGNFQNKDIFYHKPSGKLYFKIQLQGKMWDIRWAIFAGGMILTHILSSVGSHLFTSQFTKYALLFGTVLIVSLLIEWVVRPKYTLELTEFNPKQYFEWNNFLERMRMNVIFLWIVGLAFLLITIQLLLAYLAQADFYHYLIFSMFYTVMYIPIFKLHPIRRLSVLKKVVNK